MAERLDAALAAGPLLLLGWNPPPTRILSGDRASFDLFWQAVAAPTADYALRWHLSSPEGDVLLEETVPLSRYRTALWREQELVQVRYDLSVTPDLPAADYNLMLNILDSEGARLWDMDYLLASVTILARERQFTLPSGIAYPLDFSLGRVVHLRGFDIGGLSVQPGSRLPLRLYWQADGPTDLSYTVFIHLIGPDGLLHGQVDRLPADGAAPTHSWAHGQVVVDEIALPVLADAPLGTYRIAVGLYEQEHGGRLPVYDASGAELPDRQILLPLEVTVE